MGAVLGGLCPLPIRLGGDDESGWTANKHARVCADLAAVNRTLPFAVVTLTRGNSPGDAPSIVRYSGKEAPGSLVLGGTWPNDLTLTWDQAPENELGERYQLRINSFSAHRHGDTIQPTCEITAPHQVTIGEVDGGDAFYGTITVKVYASWGKAATIEDYGGDLDKRDAERETVPYAWLQYQDLTGSLGSGYGTAMSGAFHSRKLAIARALAACLRSEERLRANAHPDTADAMLEEWTKSVNVAVPFGESKAKTRKYTALMFRAESGQSIPAIERACSALLGDKFIGVRVFDIDDPASVWPTSWDIGGGVWASTRCKFLVDVKPPLNAGDQEFKDLVQVRLMNMLDRIAPSHSWFNWTIPGDGFFLDVSPLDYTAL